MTILSAECVLILYLLIADLDSCRSCFPSITPPLAMVFKIGMVRLSRTDLPSTSPCSFRSSGQRPIPALMASLGLLILHCLPSTYISPLISLSAPNKSRMVSERPAPTRPAKPRTWPLLRVKLTSCTYSPSRCLASRITSPILSFRSSIE